MRRDIISVLRERPEWVLVMVALLVAIVFAPYTPGAIGLTIVVIAIGVFASSRWQRIPKLVRDPSPRLAKWFVLLSVFGLVVWTFYDQSKARHWMMGDYPAQKAALAQLVPALREGHIPAWSMGLSTGESPFELYPAFTYVLAAAMAIVGGVEKYLTELLVVIGILAHVVIVMNVVRIVYRVASRWVAFVIGVVLIVDYGSISAGGLTGIEWGLIHSAVAQAIGLFGIVAVIDFIDRPRLARALTIWISTAIATAAHPSALLATAGAVVALGFVAMLSRDTPPRRPLVAALHLCVGAALGAVVWVPLGARLLEYGQHFSNALRSPARLFEDLMQTPHPPGLFTGVIYAGYIGLVIAIWSRSARRVFIGALGIVMLLGFIDVPYVFYDLAPDHASARLGADRFHALARPAIFVAAGYLLMLVVQYIRSRWTDARPRDRAFAGAILAISIALFARAIVPFWFDTQSRAREFTFNPASRDGQTELVAWARAQMQQLPPDRYARALSEMGGQNYHHHLTADTGMPTFHMGPLPNLLGRERIEDTSPESLRRFNVRWVLHRGASPSLGDEATEQVFGTDPAKSYYVREVSEWDGQFARIERGTGTVRTLEIANERVKVELTNTTTPALVALGTGYYPRWRATHDGKPIKVYAFPSIPGGKLHVVAAWIPPGLTTFTCDGPLPSDGGGRFLAGAALLFVCAVITIWSRRNWRTRLLRLVARTRPRIARRAPVLRIAAVAFVALALVAWGILATNQPARTLEVGSGLRGVADVTAFDTQTNSVREDCSYRRLEGGHRCSNLFVYDTTDTVLNDEQHLWPYTSPVIRAIPNAGKVVKFELTITTRLAGKYWIGSVGSDVKVTIGDAPPIDTTTQAEITLPDADYTITIAGFTAADGTSIAFIREDTLRPPRTYLAPPPEAPPPSLAP